jgi:hypothetical protein
MKNPTLPSLAVLLAGMLSAQFDAGAATLINWDFSGLPATTVENGAIPNPILGSASANAASGLSSSALENSGLLYSTAVAPGGTGTSVPGELNVKNFDIGSNGTNDNYLFFTITAGAGNALDIDSIGINVWRNGGGAPNGMAFDVSVDGGAFQLYDAVSVLAAAGNGGPFVPITFTQAISGANSVEIRFTPRNAGAGSTGNLHINGLDVMGSVVPIPEPSSHVLILSGLVAMLVRRRR